MVLLNYVLEQNFTSELRTSSLAYITAHNLPYILYLLVTFIKTTDFSV